jgi:hypothetical protein
MLLRAVAGAGRASDEESGREHGAENHFGVPPRKPGRVMHKVGQPSRANVVGDSVGALRQVFGSAAVRGASAAALRLVCDTAALRKICRSSPLLFNLLFILNGAADIGLSSGANSNLMPGNI